MVLFLTCFFVSLSLSLSLSLGKFAMADFHHPYLDSFGLCGREVDRDGFCLTSAVLLSASLAGEIVLTSAITDSRSLMASVVARGLRHRHQLTVYLPGHVTGDVVRMLEGLSRGNFNSAAGDAAPVLCASVLKKNLLIFRLDTENMVDVSPHVDFTDGPVPAAGATIMVARSGAHFWAVVPPRTAAEWACLRDVISRGMAAQRVGKPSPVKGKFR
jgi:hypothetical protein